MPTFAKGKKNFIPSHLGVHLIAEFLDCKSCHDTRLLKKVLREAAIASGATILDQKYHMFRPQGMTGYILLKESHISIHTWPEYGYAAIDVFTCGSAMKPEVAIQRLKEALVPARMQVKKVVRGKLS